VFSVAMRAGLKPAQGLEVFDNACVVFAGTRTYDRGGNIVGLSAWPLATNEGNDMQSSASNVTGFVDGGGGLSRKVDAANMTVHHAIDRASSAAGPAIDQFAAGAHEAADRLALAANQAAASLETTAESLKTTQARLTDSCGNYVREKPVTALSIAVAGGFLLGMLLRRR